MPTTAMTTDTRPTGTIVLAGELGYEAAARLERRLDALLRSGEQRVLLDFTQAVVTDTSLIGVVLRARDAMEARGGELAVVLPRSGAWGRFCAVLLGRVVQAFDLPREALVWLGPGTPEAASAPAV